MRRWAVAAGLVAALAGVGCGDDGDGDDGPAGPASGTALTVTGSLAFVAGNAAAVSQATSCDVGGVGYGLAYAAMLASDQGGICGYLERGEDKANARSVRVAVVRIDLAGDLTSVTAGTYPIRTDPALEAEFAQVAVSQNDATCSPSDIEATSGTVTITATEGGRLRGTIDATLSDGGTIIGPFDAEGCEVSFEADACAGELGPQDPTCAE